MGSKESEVGAPCSHEVQGAEAQKGVIYGVKYYFFYVATNRAQALGGKMSKNSSGEMGSLKQQYSITITSSESNIRNVAYVYE